MDLGLRVLSYLISGVLVYGLLGWLGDHYFGTRFLLPIGIVAGAAFGAYVIIRRFGRIDDAAPATGAKDRSNQATVTGHAEGREGGTVSGFLSGLIPLETDSGGFEAPGVQSFDVPPLFEDVPWLEWFDKYMLQSHHLGDLDLDLLDDHGTQERHGAQQGPVPRRNCVLLRPEHDRPGHDRARLPQVPSAADRPVLLRVDQQHLRGLPAQLATHALARRLALRPGDTWSG